MVPYKDIFLALNKAGIRYLVAGGIALNLHQIIRATVDLDLIVQFEKKNVLDFVSVMTGLGYCPRVPVKAEELADPTKRESWITEKNMTVFSFIHPTNPMEIVDIFVTEPIPFGPAFDRRKDVEAFGIKIHVLSVEDLIALKTLAGRSKDLYDIDQLKKLL